MANPTASGKKIGFIGLGIMGAPMCEQLVDAGHQLFVHTRGEVPASIAKTSATVCKSNREVAQHADIVIVMVPDTPNVDDVLFAEDGVAAGLSKGKIVVDMSSISPVATKGFARKINALGCEYLDAPVSGGEVGARAASLSIMVGGSQATFDTVARDAGITPAILGDAIEGEARDVGKVLAGIALQVAQHGQPVPAPCVLLSGGETTVTVRGNGRGGRNVECLLALGVAFNGHPRIHAIAGDTDGVDGQEEIAGAIVAPDTLARAWARQINPRERLADNDGHGFFEALGDSVVTGPTLTNVNDFRAIFIEGK